MTEHTETHALADYWREHVEAWQTGGDSQAANCKAHELIYHRFVYWRRKFDGGASRCAVTVHFAQLLIDCQLRLGMIAYETTNYSNQRWRGFFS